MPHSSGRIKTAHPLPGSAADSERPTDDVGRKSAGLHESVGETTAAGFRFRFHAWALRLRLLPPQRVIQAASLWDWNHRQAACLTALPGLTHPKSISGISGMEGPLRVVRTKSGSRQALGARPSENSFPGCGAAADSQEYSCLNRGEGTRGSEKSFPRLGDLPFPPENYIL